MARNPFRIWSEIVEERQKQGQHEATRAVIIHEFLRNGYGPEKAKKWVDLYTKEFAISEKNGRIRLW